MSDTLIKVSRLSDVAISLDAGALAQKAEALEMAQAVTQVEGETDQTVCVEVLRDVKRLRKLCEESRVLVKGPVLEIGRDIDKKASLFDIDLALQEVRLTRLLSGFESRQRAIAEEAERKRREEIERVERERKQAEEKARREAQAELDRIERERQAERNAAKTAAAAREAEQRAEQQRTLALNKIEADRAEAAKESQAKAITASAAVVPAPAKVEGTRVKEEWKFEVLDPAAVYAAHPEYCDVSVSKSLVNAAMKRGLRECPGLRIWKETRAEVLT